MIWWFLWIAWIVLLFRVIADIFRSHDLGGFAKALWAIFVIIVPWLGVLIYLIARGHTMAERDTQQAQAQDDAFRSYVQDAAPASGGGTADELAKLADLKAQGVHHRRRVRPAEGQAARLSGDRQHRCGSTPMNIVWAALIIVAATAVAVAAMLLVRRRAPEGSYFADSDRAAGIFGVLATGFSVLLGFLIFLGFESYDASRTRRRDRGARPSPSRSRRPRSCPADVGADAHRRTGLLRPLGHPRRVGPDGGRARSATTSTRGASRCSRRCATSSSSSPVEEAAYGKWLDQTSTGRRPARSASTAPPA